MPLMRKVRVGIDVGGTFTDAVAIDDATYEIIAQEKIPTTHAAREGVAEGIIRILQELLSKNHIAPAEVSFIAHGTTQATNALLEGDVAKTGILSMGSGLESSRVRTDSNVGDIPLAQGKALRTVHAYVETEDAAGAAEEIRQRLADLQSQGAEVIVVSESFGVDDPTNEEFAAGLARAAGLYATGGHEVSKLYGLRVRTRTAVINGSLIPKMMETADMTEACIKRSGIGAKLMIMRCDGGVMTVEEMRRRPILTMLSGLAAGVAGALMYERLSDGIFLEAGGTSTDISAVRNGRVIVRYAQVGGHKTYLNSLDVRTVGVAGGSMIRVANKRIIDVGPRSAHIAGLDYEAFTAPLQNPQIIYLAPCAGDTADFIGVDGADGRRVALTLAGAANLLGYIQPDDYAAGNDEAVQIAWQALGKELGISAEQAAQQAMEIGVGKIRAVVEALIKDYSLASNILCLAGGGGSASVIVPYLGQSMACSWKIVRNAPIISTIGAALAMVREVVERTISNPSPEDIRSIRQEALSQVMRSGATEATVEISIEIDRQANILRAVAMGTAELRTRSLAAKELSADARQKIAAASMNLLPSQVNEIAATGKWHIYEGLYQRKWLFFFHKTMHRLRVLDRDGVIRLQREPLGILLTTCGELFTELPDFLDSYTEYGTVGEQLPAIYGYFAERQLDLSGLISREQVVSVLTMELDGVPDKTPILLVAVK